MGIADAENMAKYKSYIQRRRVAQDTTDPGIVSNSVIGPIRETADSSKEKKSSLIDDIDLNNIDEYFKENEEKTKSESTFDIFGETERISPFKDIEQESPLKDLLKEDSSSSWYTGTSTYSAGRQSTSSTRRTNLDLYRRLYGGTKKSTKTHRYSAFGRSASRNTLRYAQLEDNGAELLAIKIIKQSLACFAILGLVVFLQQLNNMAGVLEFVKKHVVDSHIDHRTVFSGVESIVEACSKFLGGSP